MDKAQQELLEQAKQSIIAYDKGKAEEIAKKALGSGMDPNAVITQGFVPGITEVGDLFDRGRLFLPELMMAAEAMQGAAAICTAALPQSEIKASKKVVIGTVEGDVHDIGKSLVVSMLLANGFEVYDVGRDAPTAKFIDKVKEVGADVVGSSALLTTTMEKQKEIEEELKKAGLREKVKTIVGGAPCNEPWAKRIGADAYAENAVEGVRKIQELTGLV